jgi:hypothetical protein
MAVRQRRQRQDSVPDQVLISCIGPGVVNHTGRTVSVRFIELALGLYPRFEAHVASDEEAARQVTRLRAALESSPGMHHVTFEGAKRFLLEHGRPLQWMFRNEEFPAQSQGELEGTMKR